MERDKKIKVTYTFEERVYRTLKNRAFIEDTTISDMLTKIIKIGFNNTLKYELGGGATIKKRKNTISKTFVIPDEAVDIINYFSDSEDLKKSYVVHTLIVNYEFEESAKLSKSIDRMMRSVKKNIPI